MRVAIVGAGALGTVYGALLARSGCDVELVGRTARPTSRVSLERVGAAQTYVWEMPAAAPSLSAEADVALVTVRYEDLDDLAPRVATGKAPLVVLTPMLPSDRDALGTRLPGRVVPAMPSVISYRSSPDTVRFWLPSVATTLVERRSTGGAEVDLARRLTHAGLPSRLELGVLERNAATTVTFMPLAMAVAAARSVDGLLADRALLTLTFDATRESAEVARTMGKPEAWATMLMRFVGPFRLRAGISLARARAPEVLRYVDEHFARKLSAQTALFAEQMVSVARRERKEHRALDRLLDRLRAAPSAASDR